MKTSFVDFVNKYLPDPIQLYPYQLEFLKYIENNNEPINFRALWLKQRQHSRRIEHSLHLYYTLLSNKSVLDLFLGLYFKFELNEYDELELIIDEYSQSNNTILGTGSVSVRPYNMRGDKMYHNSNPKKKENIQMLKEALAVIKEIT